MKKRHLFLLFPLALAMQGCPYIASGDNEASYITMEELQGCLYTEWLTNSRDSHLQIQCVKNCIEDSIYYEQIKIYNGPKCVYNKYGLPDCEASLTDSTLANIQWVLDTIITSDTSLVSIAPQDKDGYYFYNIHLGNRSFNYESYLEYGHRFGTKEWTLCKE